MSTRTISVRELHESIQAGNAPEIVDVRTPLEFREVHIEGARNIPLHELNPTALLADRNGEGGPLYVICRSGQRGQQACAKLEAAGGENVVNVEGGTSAWEAAGYAVVRGKKAISLERQVRIAAGSLVLVSAVLGFLVSPYWIGLAAFVGAGLVFAGITDTCGMGMLLARMPWNQAPRKSAEADSDADSQCESTEACGR